MGQKYKFFFYAKNHLILRSCSMKIFSTFLTINISKRNFWLVICIAKNFIWTSLKMIFSIFRFFLHPQIPDLQILSKPYINGNIIYSAFRWCIHIKFEKCTLMTGFVLQGQIRSLSSIHTQLLCSACVPDVSVRLCLLQAVSVELPLARRGSEDRQDDGGFCTEILSLQSWSLPEHRSYMIPSVLLHC